MRTIVVALVAAGLALALAPTADAEIGCNTNIDESPFGPWYAECHAAGIRCGVSFPIFCPCFPPCSGLP